MGLTLGPIYPPVNNIRGSIRGEGPRNDSLFTGQSGCGVPIFLHVRMAPELTGECSLSRRVNPEHLISSQRYGLRGGLAWNATEQQQQQQQQDQKHCLQEQVLAKDTPAVTLTSVPSLPLLYTVDHAAADVAVSFTPGNKFLQKRRRG